MAICKGCGREIVWATTLEGKNIPLDPSAPVYFIQNVVEENGAQTTMASRSMCHLVSHFCTCPAANQFSGKNKVKKGSS